MLELINSLLGRKEVLEIEGDGDHKWERGEEMWNSYTHLDPRANFLYRQALDLQMLREGKMYIEWNTTIPPENSVKSTG